MPKLRLSSTEIPKNGLIVTAAALSVNGGNGVYYATAYEAGAVETARVANEE